MRSALLRLFLHDGVARACFDRGGAIRFAFVSRLDEHDHRHFGHLYPRANEHIHRGVERPREIEEHDVDALIGEPLERFVAHADGRERERGKARDGTDGASDALRSRDAGESLVMRSAAIG